MPPNYVKAYVKRNKHDAADAEAICEAVRRPSMRFVALKTVEQQSALMMRRARDLLIRQRTMLVNALRGHLAEFGLIEAQGLHKVAGLVAIVVDEMDERVPDMARHVLKLIVSQIEDNQTAIAELDAHFM
jgi:transposase